MKQATNLAVIALLTIITIFLIMLPKVQPKTNCHSVQHSLDSLQNLYDSVGNVNDEITFTLSRYETAYEIFMRRNPKAAQQYGTIISDETE